MLLDGVRPLTGPLLAGDARRDAASFRRAGLQVALAAHGSEIRLPSRHRELYPYSPFDPALPETQRMQARAERFGGVLARDQGPTYVSTPDLLDFAPKAQWLPVVVDAEPWRSDAPVSRAGPTGCGAHPVQPVPQGQRGGGRRAGPAARRGPDRVQTPRRDRPRAGSRPRGRRRRRAGQLVLGCYGVMAVQAMCAGRLVVAHVAEHVRARLPAWLPVVESGPADVEAVIDQVLADRERYRSMAAEGPGYAADLHDGRRSAAVLGAFLGATPDGGRGAPAR